MKFRFCGDGDCPDWVLAEIHSNLAQLTPDQLNQLGEHTAKSILGAVIPEDEISKIYAITKGSMDAPKGGMACLRFLLTIASRYNTEIAVFGTELQQLGLPKEHTAIMCRLLGDHVQKIRTVLRDNSLSINQLETFQCSIPKNTIDCIQLKIGIHNEIVDGVPQKTNHTVNLNRNDALLLLNELKSVRDTMENYNFDKKYTEEK
ncbi:COMM domain-containing protein 4 [Anopheles ziemanni]|uniref:COMM domain-containing protein 4 n=1 Tax=Anopheles coustani TaxID=139045 RepID=UPI0026582343|nr:COMM domain-containing protein 4 [Anopheles coustani]XP_058172971.1 COMM domain-containing protein 4 [Anopheles ziemanni]